jgi:outer membrane protein assembly factor BamB
MSRCLCPALLLATFTLAGCASPRPVAPPRLLVGHETAAVMGYRAAWPADLGLRGGQRVLFAEVLGDKFVTFESDNIVTVLDAATGRTLWRTRVGSPLERFTRPQRDGDRLVLCSETRCHLYDIQVGGLVNVVELAHVSNTTPVLVGGLMIHGSPKGLAYAQDLDTGILEWTFYIGGDAATDPVLAGPLVIVTANTAEAGWVFAFDPVTGVPAWRTHTWGRISTQAAASDAAVFIASEDRSIYAFARAPGRPGIQGRQEWRYYTEDRLRTPPSVFGETVYQLLPREGLLAMDALSGTQRWTLRWRDARPFMLKDGRLYVLRRGKIAIVSPEDGLVLEELHTPDVHMAVPQTPRGGDLYLLRTDGRILKLVPQ